LDVHRMNDSLEAKQRELEDAAREGGIKRYRKKAEQDQAAVPPGRRLLRAAVQRMNDALKEELAKLLRGKANQRAWMAHILDYFETDAVALLTATKCIQALALPHPKANVLQNLAGRIAGELQDELMQRDLQATNPKKHRSLQRKASKAGSRRRHIILRRYRATTIKLDAAKRTELGTFLVHTFCESTNIATVETITTTRARRPHSEMRLIPTESTRKWLEKAHANAESVHPLHPPMVVPPLNWTSPSDGGYRTEGLRLDVLKAPYAYFLREIDMSRVYSAINTLQKTSWAVNAELYEIMRYAWDAGQTIGGLPTKEPTAIPTKPEGGSKEELSAWSMKAAQIHEENNDLTSVRFSVAQALAAAGRMLEFDRFWFVYTVDFRGRVYPVVDFLSPQGDDLARGLLRFADGVPLGEDGERWLAIHGANCYGVDKAPFEDRVAWVRDNEEQILSTAADPLVHTFWSDGDGGKPWRFLAFCKEWAKLRTWTKSGKAKEDFVSHLPVALDGTCNGLQNFSMLMRDELGGAATNLVPGKKPEDIYQRVAAKAECIVNADAAAGHERAKLWVGKVTRKLAKRPTMTTPYGSGRYGFTEQLLEALREIQRDKGEDPLERVVGKDRFEACVYLADVMVRAIKSEVKRAVEAMEWLQKVVALVAEEGLPMSWSAPSGLAVSQGYMKPVRDPLDFRINGCRYQLTLTAEGSELDKKRQRQGIAANYIHSLDAAHLVSTVNYAAAAGIDSFAMVHDSFATHAGKTVALARELRRAFVEQYTPNLLEKFREDAMRYMSNPKLLARMPKLPDFGSLEPAAVCDSAYFFC
jgi:DNA-directed RNA polymerase